MSRENGGTRAGLAREEGGKLGAARRFLQLLAESGELVVFGQVTVHVTEGRLWLEVRKTFK